MTPEDKSTDQTTQPAAMRALHRAAQATGHRVSVLDSSALRIDVAQDAGGAGDGSRDRRDTVVTAAVVVDDGDALTASYRAQVDWHGILDGEDFIAAQATINAWNNGHIAPRLIGYRDENGHVRLRGEVVLNSFTGVSLTQLTEWAQMVVTAAHSLDDYLQEQWPNVAKLPVETPPEAAERLPDASDAADASDEAAGLIDEDTPEVTLERIADSLGIDGATVEHSDDAGNGTVPVTVGDVSLDVSFHAPVITVSAGARFGEMDADTAGYLLSVCSRWNANPAGIVIVLRELEGEAIGTDGFTDAALVAALHLPAPTGLTDEQLTAAVTASCRVVADSFSALVADITGD